MGRKQVGQEGRNMCGRVLRGVPYSCADRSLSPHPVVDKVPSRVPRQTAGTK